ncbi:MAG: SBBP repeat-containing protein [Candidatus Thorarchaeota archaeon]
MTKGSLSSAGLVVMLGFLLIVNSVQILHLGESIIIDDETSTGALSEEMLKERAQQVVEAQFYENLGQIQNNDIRFYGDVAGLGIGFTDSGVVYRISSRVEESQENIVDITQSESIFVTLRFEGANEVTLHGNGLLPHKSNYFIGNNLDEWHTDVCSYSEIVYPDLYNNIDLIYRVSEGGLKYEFIVWPGGDPSDINLHYEGIDGLSVDQDGALVASTAYGPLVDGGLYIYQVTESGQMEIEGEFKRGHEDRFDFGFQIAGNYCKAMPLVIDPFLHYSTFVGGSSNDDGYSITLDSSDNAYVTGYTQSANFPTTPGANDTSHNGNYDVFILKLSADGSTLLYSTFVGGSSNDYVRSIALDSSDNAYVTGYTDSSNFPTTHGANDTSHNGGSDVFIVKIDFRPMITIYGPTNTTYADDFVSIDYAITTSENYATEILLDGVSNSTAVPSGSLWSDLSDGSHNLTIIVTISNGDYAIETTIFSIDLTAPDVDSPMDITYLVNSAHFYVDWTVGDRTPGWYKVEGNGSTIGLTSWSENGTISFSIDSLAAGLVYNHTITVYDALGHSVTDTVFVRVVERTELSSPMDVTIEFGSTGNYLTWTIGNIWWPLPSYRIDGNATTVEWTACTDETIVLSIDGLDVGVWNFTVMTMDQYGYNTTDTVFVMVVDTIAPIIDSPLGIVYNETDTGNIITWTPSDLRPESYEIFRNGSSIESRTWDGSAIPRNVDGLTAGVYNYTLVVRDSSGNTGFDTVMVVVLALTSTTTTTTVTTTETTSTTSTTDTTTPPPDNTLLVIGIGGAGVGAVIVVIMLILKRRKL